MKVKFIFLFAALFSTSVTMAQDIGTQYVPVSTQSAFSDVSRPLTEVGPLRPLGSLGHHLQKKTREVPNLFEEKVYKNREGAFPKGNDPVWQQNGGTRGMSNPFVNFEGIRNDDNAGVVAPPDTDGDVGTNNYFQMCNTTFEIFDKQGNSLFGPADNSTIWNGFGGSWTGTNDGDPIVLYDQQADRWLVSQFAVHCSDGTFWILVAISTGPNPTGSYYRYAFQFASYPDYPKFGIWRDGYYLMVQHGDGSVTAASLNRSQMLAGTSPAQMVSFSVPNLPGDGFIGMLPSDNDGQWAPLNSPNYFAYFSDDAWGSDPVDRLKIWEFHVNWTTPGSSTLALTTNINTAAFNSEFGTHNEGIIPQAGTTYKLAVLEKALMNRMQYRNFGTYESMVCCHTVDVNGANRAGIRWYELRKTSGTSWYIYQQGTYSPGTTDNYWMASIAQNGDGDIALGFSISSGTRYPSIHYTGRNTNDPLGQMTMGEKSIFDGSHYQGGARWGDYTMMSVDPSNDETFWYTNEYLGVIAGTWAPWITRVASFSLGDNCAASGGCYEYISRVQAGTIDNSSACTGYGDYTTTHSTNIPVNGIVHVTVTNGYAYSDDQCGIWVDWNRNGIFTDAGETISVSATPGYGPYTATIIPPAGQTLGNCIMRIRIIETGTLSPCGTSTYGEVEDYTLNVTARVPNYWTGNSNNYWGNSYNWSLEHIPTADEDVVIPNVNMPCIVDYTTKVCDYLTLQSGATLQVSGSTLTVNGNMDIFGQLTMDNSAGILNVMGDIYWESGSTANITAASLMWIYGYWEFRNGATVQLANGYVDFTGSSTNYIRTYSPNCSFNNVGIYKPAGYSMGLSGASTYDLTINGYLAIQPNATFNCLSSHSLILRGSFFNNNHFTFDYGTLVMDGVSQSIKPNVGDYVKNLTISATGTTTVDNTYSGTLKVKGSLAIESGTFNPLNNTVEVGGDWTNSVGASAFTEGTGRVIFNGGNFHQYCSNETFYTLEVDKPLGGAFRMNGTNVACSHYDWTAGAVDVLTGSFTANDLLDNGLYGSYYVNPGGTINLHNTDGWVDLDGYIYVLGGNFNVYGGAGSDSFWPVFTNGGITMSGGTLDFKDVGVLVNNTASYTLTENITGGTIRTSGNFVVERADYTPSGGTLEFYGPANGNFKTINGGYVRNVIINKSVADNMEGGGNRVIRDRETGAVTDVPLANTITLTNSADINGSVTIQAGVLSAGSNSIYVEGNWDNQAGTAGFAEGTSTVNFDGLPYADIVNGETFYNMNVNKTNTNYNALELISGNTVNVLNSLYINDGAFDLNGATALNIGNELVIVNGAGLNATGWPAININLAGSWYNYNTDYDIYHGFDPGYYSTVTFNGTIDQYLVTSCPQEDFHNLTINKPSGKFRPVNNIQSFWDVWLENGSWEDYTGGLTHTVYGNFTVASTAAFLTTSVSNTVQFKGAQNSVLTYSSGTGYFRHLLVNKSVGYSVSQATSVSTQFGGNLTVGTGIYNLNGNYLFVAGDIAVNSTGILSLPAASTLNLTDSKSLNVNSGGRINISGTPVSPVNIKANVVTSRYNFNVNSGATIAADYCLFQNTGANGVYVTPTGIVDLAHAFRGCTFQDGAAGGTLLALNNAQTITIRNAVFPENTWSGNSNVAKTLNSGHVYFVDYSGGFSGEDYDADGWNLIDWVPTLTATPTATPATICAGSTSQLNAHASGGVPAYTCAWSPAATLSSASSPTPVATPGITTLYTVTVTDALGSTAINNVTVTVNPVLPVSISISPSSNPVPPNTFVTFTATIENGGTLPSYKWLVNGITTDEGVGLTSITFKPANHAQVSCVLTSNYPCPSGNPATSNVITMIVVATDKTVTGEIPSPLAPCFDATHTITVGSLIEPFIVRGGASATMIAGYNILYLPGTLVEPNGYMHGYITTTNTYCGFAPPTMVTVVAGEEEMPADPLQPSRMFSIYPNPTTGIFTLFHKGDNLAGAVQVEIFDLQGNRILSTSYTREKSHKITLPSCTPGLYFVKVISGDIMESFKLVVTR